MVSRPLTRSARLARSVAARVTGQIRRQFITRNRRMAFVLTIATVAIGVAAVHLSEWWFSPGLMILPILAGGLLLWPRALRILFGIVVVMLAYDWWQGVAGTGGAGTIGVKARRGDKMLIELRDRLRVQGRLPVLPEGWDSVSVLRPAGGASFGGDFL